MAEKKGFLKKVWEKSIFPEKIKTMQEEKDFKKQLEKEAKTEAREEAKVILKKQMKQKEIDRITGKKKKGNFGSKLANGFSMGDTNTKLGNMLGTSGGSSNDKIGSMMGMGETEKKKTTKKKGKKGKKKEDKIEDFEDKIKRMLE